VIATRAITTTRPGPVWVIEGLLAPRYAQRLLDHWEGFRGYWLSSDGGTPPGRVLACPVAHRPAGPPEPPPLPPHARPALLSALGQRADAAANFVRTGGRLGGSDDTVQLLHRRTDYFRATYVNGRNIHEPVVCRLLNHPVLADAARQLFGRPVVVPTEVYANVMLPGQELGLHTDVPEFRGATRTRYPLWLLVVMQHSGLFEPWRTHLATAVLHLGRGGESGGEFAYFPDGPNAAPAAIRPRHNTALLLDTDTLLHGVDRLGGPDAVPVLRTGMRLRHEDGRWRLRDRDGEHGDWSSAELRYSVSWKAQCFADDSERRVTMTHTDDLTYDLIMARLLTRLPPAAERLAPDALGRLLIDTYVQFPA
jgi:hypothetical protein